MKDMRLRPGMAMDREKASWGERLTGISTEITDAKRVVVIVVVGLVVVEGVVVV